MSPIKIRRIAHIVLYVADPEASSAWYSDVLGMKVVARVGSGPYKGGVFLSFGESDHDIALFPDEVGATKGREFEHIGLELASRGLDDLRRMLALFLAKGVRVHEILDHGVSVGIYFYDPDGHMLEVFHQKISQSDGAAIQELTENEGKADPITLEPLAD
jgi:catechol 2,3-dioxygenase-like lactoylglutathione lyase family enzyme